MSNRFGHWNSLGAPVALTSQTSAPLKIALIAMLLVCTVKLPLLATSINGIEKLAPVTITGVVLDDKDSEPVPGVSIVDKNKRTLAVTGLDGSFRVTAESGTQLSFTALGYTTYQLTLSENKTGLRIRLVPSTSNLNEVVVTALGIKKEERTLGYAATVITGEQLTDAVAGNWTDALAGKVPGLNLVRSNSGPAGSNKIILRGENNLTGDNEALYVVDGVVINNSSGRRTANTGESVYGTSSDNMPADYGSGLNDINPEDIESVSVLPGPSAAALYGQRGANGAIVITTKAGSSKRKGLGITFNSNASMESVNRWPDMQFEYGQGLDGAAYYSFGAGADGASTSGTSSAYGPRFDGQMFYQFDPVTQARGTERTPWVAYPNKIRKFFETGQTITNTVSVDGGTDRTTARFSATNVSNKWITPNTGYGRNSVALSVNSKVNDKLTISSKINYNNRSSDNLPGAGYGNQSLMYWFIFWQPNADLDWLKNYWVKGQENRRIFYPYSSFPENPYAVSYEFINRSNRNTVTGNISATYNFSKELSLQLRTSMDMGYEQRAQERPYDAGTRMPKGSYRSQNIFSQEVSSDFLMKYAKAVSKDFDFSLSAGGSILRNNYNRDEIRADSLTYPGVYTIANAAGPLVSMPDRSKYSINSFYGIAGFDYRNFLHLELTGRQDWSSVLATPERTDNVGFFYPSANMSLIVSDLFKLPKVISFAKLRASVAQVGSGGTTPYRTSYNYSIAGGGLYPGGSLSNPTLLPSPDLKPLMTTAYEVGANVNFFSNRLGFDLALYTGNTKNQILTRVIDRSSGFSNMLINLGQVNNEGLELSVNAKPIKTKNFNWSTNFIFSANRNTITELGDSSVVLRTGPVGGGQIVAQVGGSMGDLYGRGYVRSPDGQVVYDENTGFAKISSDVVYLGNTIPKFRTSFSSNFSYKQFRLNVLFDAQVGAVAHSLMNYKLVEQGKLKSTLPGRYNGIIGNGVIQNADGTYRPNDKITYDIDEYYRSHMGIDNAEGSTFSTDFIKFREARFDYTLPAKTIKMLGLQRATIGAYGRNLYIWSPWPMFDPEFGTLSGTDIVTGFETAQFPSTRTFGLNLTIGI
ncbi:SusC/RagA family TonB-linked outer membrane protein [Pedobacter sp. SYSU D00535]|uniref:SusC/RagA family TonB-linked outer membrane protein n=1 Tax=Pedobacter sp. SYSU D00535 TaxID=2810308 RepID=UPI001F60ABEC|nr:SusC/RagA family TonB-linked outer membrane protein [Pedobacter sp. SYSU D00535]